MADLSGEMAGLSAVWSDCLLVTCDCSLLYGLTVALCLLYDVTVARYMLYGLTIARCMLYGMYTCS